MLKSIVINKNRGWRGLAELKCFDDNSDKISSVVFSFSQPMWEDLLTGHIVVETDERYLIVEFDNLDRLPKPTQQRSVLIKNFIADVTDIRAYGKKDWTSTAHDVTDYQFIYNFIKNRNNHTTSDWNCIGIRVVPVI